MVRWFARGLVAGLTASRIAAPGRAQTVHGLVLYAHSDAPVVMATVKLVDPDGHVVATTLTDIDGRFVLSVPADGSHLINAEHVSAWSMVDGPLDLSTAANTMVAFHMEPHPIALEGLDVEVEGRSRRLARTGFYERREQTAGFFLDDQAIARRAPIRTSDLIRTVPGLQFIEGRSAGMGGYPIMSYALRSQVWTRSDAVPCFPRVYIDGVETPLQIAGTGASRRNPALDTRRPRSALRQVPASRDSTHPGRALGVASRIA
jgi:hypothetical protein